MKTKIILVGPLPPPSHGQSMSFEMLANILSIENDVKVIDIADRRKTIKNNFIGKLLRIGSYFRPLFFYSYNVLKHNSRIYLTIAQSRNGFIRDWFFISFGHLFGRRVVVHLKGGNYREFYRSENALFKFLIRKTLLKTERILVLGKNLVHMYDFEPALKSKVFVVENGLPFESPLSRPKKSVNESFNLLFLSNMIESKGYFDVLEAIKQLVALGHNVNVDFAGAFLCNVDDKTISSEEDAKNKFEKFISDNDLRNNVTYHGTVSGDHKLKLLRKANAFILPTNYNNEGQPVSIIEALAFGLPIISTNYRAIPDMLIDDVTGKFVEFQSPSSIVSAVLEISQNSVYEKMTSNCISLFEEKFTREAHIARISAHILGR